MALPVTVRLLLHATIYLFIITLSIVLKDAGVICLATIPVETKVWDKGNEILTHSEDPDTGNKEVKKEIKAFIADTDQKPVAALTPHHYQVNEAVFFPQPLLNKHTPPPDPAC